MDLDNNAAESGLDTGNAGGEPSSVATPAAPSQGLSLKDSLAKAATSIRDRSSEPSPAREAGDGHPTALETSSKNDPRSLPGQPSPQEEPASSILEAPKHWPQKRRDAFGRFLANPDAQKEWLEHTKELEGEFTRKSQEHAETRKFADTVRELFAPEQRALLQQTGANEVQAIKWWSELDQFSRRDPAGYAKWFMQQSGLTPQQLFPELGQGSPQAQPADGQGEWIDPEFVKLREEKNALSSRVEALVGELNQLKGWASSQQRERQTHVQQTIESAIQQFAGAASEDGQPLHPHFNAVEQRMVWEFQNNPNLVGKPVTQEALKTAYDAAVWADPETRNAMLEAQQAAQQQQIVASQAAAKAKAAATIKPKLGSVAGVKPVPPSDLKSLIRDAASRARG